MHVPRWVPFAWALIDLAIAAALLILWQPSEHDFWWFVRGLLFSIFALLGLGSLKNTFFASQADLQKLVQDGDEHRQRKKH